MYYDQYQDDMDYEFNAQYDYIKEAYGPTAEGLADEHEVDPPYIGKIEAWEFCMCDCANYEIPF